MRHLLVGGPMDGEYRHASGEVWQVFSDASGVRHQYRRTYFEIGDVFVHQEHQKITIALTRDQIAFVIESLEIRETEQSPVSRALRERVNKESVKIRQIITDFLDASES
jgi:hypothetical protein